MDYFKNIGISYTSDYIIQGSNLDKCLKSEKLSAKYTELIVRNDGKGLDISSLNKVYHGTLLFRLPTLKYDLSNLKTITNYVYTLVKNGVKYVTIDASNLPLDIYDWSTIEEQRDFIKTIASGFAQLISNGVTLYIENVQDVKNISYFGKRVENLSDLLMDTKNILQKNYDFTKDKAESSIGISFNITKLYGNINEYDKWFNILKNNIKILKVTDVDNAVSIFDGVLSKAIENNINSVILLQVDKEIEEVTKKYRKFEYLVNLKVNNKPVTLDNYTEIKEKDSLDDYDLSSSNQSGYSSIIIIAMIVITIVVAVLMIYIKFKD